mmetsp:Transcript_25659/g.84490  ORF Transcript_25659/g.84490 Transcript_25659/m.84490 type:complete len:262 (+) Transcript_25659:331-1116(+)
MKRSPERSPALPSPLCAPAPCNVEPSHSNTSPGAISAATLLRSASSRSSSSRVWLPSTTRVAPFAAVKSLNAHIAETLRVGFGAPAASGHCDAPHIPSSRCSTCGGCGGSPSGGCTTVMCEHVPRATRLHHLVRMALTGAKTHCATASSAAPVLSPMGFPALRLESVPAKLPLAPEKPVWLFSSRAVAEAEAELAARVRTQAPADSRASATSSLDEADASSRGSSIDPCRSARQSRSTLCRQGPCTLPPNTSLHHQHRKTS